VIFQLFFNNLFKFITFIVYLYDHYDLCSNKSKNFKTNDVLAKS